jgi:dipeptidyl aminopeptidase/acylaminoacyl peptidase
MAEEVQCPYLLTHGELDAQIPIDDARALFEMVPGFRTGG